MYIVPITTVTLATQVLQVALLASLASATAPLLACMSGPTLAALSWCTGPLSSHLRGRLYSVDWTRDWTVGLDCGTAITRQTKFQQPFLPMGVLYKYVLQAK